MDTSPVTDSAARGAGLRRRPLDRLRAGVAAVLPGEPVLRTGHVLAVSSLVNAGLGFFFWTFATHWYDERTVGLSYSALMASLLLTGIGQLNLNDFLVRFVPTAGRRSRRLVLTCYAASTAFSVVVALVFLALVPVISPRLGFLLTPVTATCFVVATAGYAVFVLQDGALTAVRMPGWVVGENLIFAVVKILLLGLGAALGFFSGILLSWAGALVVSLIVANSVLMRRGLPRHERETNTAPPPPRMLGYATADYVGSLFRVAGYTVVPLIVLNNCGAEQSAFYSVAWGVAYVPYLIARNMGTSLLAESVRGPERLVEHSLRVLRHSGLLLGAVTVVLVAAAPQILSIFGASYAAEGSTLLRLLALSALPNLLLSVAIDVARAQRRLRWAVWLQVAMCVLVLGLTHLLLPEIGLVGAGVAWLVTQCLIAGFLLVSRSRWLVPVSEGSS
ncbi:lipopolysaccharide biosynthesis protein [Streptomyces sp. NPDC001914]|uniref:lipopolysaccharide biosynthesis protein n=1 Tax=Streptomyces sp. NPDC001914 TaxID=3364623 RepID=UPI0036B530B8